MNRAARRMMKNTRIPLDEVVKSIEDTKIDAIRVANKYNTKMLLSASCLVLNDKFGFDKDQCINFLNCVQKVMLDGLCATELSMKVLDKLDIDIDSVDSEEVGGI